MSQEDRTRWLEKIKPRDKPLQKWTLSLKHIPSDRLPPLNTNPRMPLPYDTLLVSAMQNPALVGTLVSIGAVRNNRPLARGMAAIIQDSGEIDCVRDYVHEQQPRSDDIKMFDIRDVDQFKVGPESGDPEESPLVQRFDSFLQLVEGRDLTSSDYPSL